MSIGNLPSNFINNANLNWKANEVFNEAKIRVHNGKIIILDSGVVTFPFTTTDLSSELSTGQWKLVADTNFDLADFENERADKFAKESWVLANTPQGLFLGSVMPSDIPTGTGESFWVATEEGIYTNFGRVVVNAGSYAFISRNSSGNFSISQTGISLEDYVKQVVVDPLLEVVEVNNSKQLFNKLNDQIEIGSFLSTGYTVSSNHNLRLKISNDRLEVGKTYTIKGDVSSLNGVPKIVFYNESNIVISLINGTSSNLKEITFTIPEFTSYTYIHLGYTLNINTQPLRDNIIVNSIMLNEGTVSLPYDVFGDYTTNLKTSKIQNYDNVLELVNKNVIIEKPKKNLLNLSSLQFDKYYSPGNAGVFNNTGVSRVGSGYIPVVSGNFYTWYINSKLNYEGGFFVNDNDIYAQSSIVFSNPVTGLGKIFQVPEGINFVYLNVVRVGTSGNTIDGDFQLENGEIFSGYEDYQLVSVYNPIYNEEKIIVNNSVLEKYTDFSQSTINTEISSKLLNFKKNWLKQSKDLVVVNTGTSLTARSDEHTTLKSNASERPPLCHSNNYFSHLADSLMWENQQYRRYDSIGFFTETGSNWVSTSNNSNWDDNIYRAGYTRFTDDVSASVSFIIPINAWQFNFIFRSEINGTENAIINILEGNGKVEVFNGVEYVEANGFIFSQKETEQYLSNVSIPDARTGLNYDVPQYKIGGNTTYQKRLKMRVIDKSIEKTITISRSSGRLLYWGVEWSEREFMISFINSARGSHNISLINSNSSSCLSHYQENEIWSFKPDILITENPIHNSYAGTGANSLTPTDYWGKVTEDFFFGSNPVSLKTRAIANSLNPEYLIFTSSISYNFGAIEEDGSLKFFTDKNGKRYTALDCFKKAHEYLIDNYPEVLSVNAVDFWVKSGISIFGNLKTATLGSGKNGNTFTNEGSHWNDNGCKIIAKAVFKELFNS